MPNIALLIRKRRDELGMSKRALARLAGVSDTLIGLIEGGNKRVTRAVGTRLAAALKLSPEELTDASEPSATQNTVLGEICGLASFNDALLFEALYGKPSDPLPLPELTIDDLPDLAAVNTAIRQLLEDAAYHSSPVSVYLEGFQDARRHGDRILPKNSELFKALHTLLRSGTPLSISFRVGHDFEHDFLQSMLAARLALLARIIKQSDKLSVGFLRGNNIHRFVRDLWISDRAYIDAFPRDHEYYVDQGMLVGGDATALKRYVCNIRKHVSSSTVLSWGPDELSRMAADLLQPSYSKTRLVQPFFSEATRPASEFADRADSNSSTWSKRMMSAIGSGDDVTKLASLYQRRSVSLIDHCQVADFEQIFDKPTVEQWALSGKRIDLGRELPDEFRDNQTEREDRLRRIISLLESVPRFHLIGHSSLAGDRELTAETANSKSGRRSSVSWLSEESGRLLVAAHTTGLSSAVKPPQWEKFETIGEENLVFSMRGRSITQPFIDAFDSYKGKNMDDRRRDTLDFLRDLLSKLDTKLGR